MSNKLMYYELGEGELTTQVQKDFEDAQAITHQRGVKTKLTIEIIIHPESREKRGTAEVEFRSKVSAPPRQSIKHITEVNREGELYDSGHRQQSILDEKGAQK
jgi:hypothetical protein